MGAAAAAMTGHAEALETMERDQAGLEPAVRAALELGIQGVHGVLADSLEAPSALSRAVEGSLGTWGR
jgi:hypothetical protein